MSRNNDERSGTRNISQDIPPISALSEQNPQPFSFVTPTEFVELPSQGRYYPEDHPLHGKDSIEIRFMTAKDEDTLTSQSLLKKGLAIKKVDPNGMLVGDRNALIVAIRSSGYGEEYKTKVSCPSCSTRTEFTFDLSEANINYGNHEEYEFVQTENKTFIINLPKSNIDMEVRLINGHDEKKLIMGAKQKKKAKLPESNATEQFKLFVVSVNGETSKSTINKFIDMMPAIDARYLRAAYKKIMPNIDMKQEFICEECEFEGPMEVPFTADFFWPK